MLSDVTYENRSRNENVERVGLFWDFSEEAGAIPLIWAVIYRCRYRWTHPIQIGRALACHLIEDDGATTKLEDLEGPLRVPGVLMSTRFRAWGEVVEVTLTEGHPYRRAALLRNGLPMVERVLPPAGRIDLPIPTALTFTADVTSKAGQPVQRYDLSPGARAFDIRRADPLQVIMFGGEPGPDCRALAFSETADAR